MSINTSPFFMGRSKNFFIEFSIHNLIKKFRDISVFQLSTIYNKKLKQFDNQKVTLEHIYAVRRRSQNIYIQISVKNI